MWVQGNPNLKDLEIGMRTDEVEGFNDTSTPSATKTQVEGFSKPKA